MGDKSRYQFYRELVDYRQSNFEAITLRTELLSHKPIEVFNSTPSPKAYDGTELVKSSKIPLFTSVYFPAEGEALRADLNANDVILIFDEFPFRTASDIEVISTIRENSRLTELRVILYNNKREMLPSDITTNEAALSEVYEAYKNQGLNVYIYRPGGYRDFLYWNSSITSNRFESDLRDRLISLREELSITFQMEFEYLYQFELEQIIENYAALASFVEYRKSYRNQVLIKRFSKNAYNYCFKDNYDSIMNPIKKLFLKSIREIAIWDIEDDFLIFRKLIMKEFKHYFDTISQVRFSGNEESYLYFLNENDHIDVLFKSKYIEYFKSKVPEMLYNHILTRIYRMERLLDET